MLSTLFRDPTFERLTRDFNSLVSQRSASRVPALNAWHDDEFLFLEAELPGYSQDDIEVLVQNDTVTLRGTRSHSIPEGAKALHVERSGERFERTLRLPVELDSEKTQAELTNGVLRIRLAKAESVRPKRVPISGGNALPGN